MKKITLVTEINVQMNCNLFGAQCVSSRTLINTTLICERYQLRPLLKMSETFVWTESHQLFFQEFKLKIATIGENKNKL